MASEQGAEGVWRDGFSALAVVLKEGGFGLRFKAR